ncbi:hypothetical protein HY025_00865 [Candidatus Daviesbacteria bacterium]|nr:hypothetical protein [Candidatus Daviesbacteria bacterium]
MNYLTLADPDPTFAEGVATLAELLATGVAELLAVGVGSRVGVGLTTIDASGTALVLADEYLPLSQTK